jgi:hypothetical protein
MKKIIRLNESDLIRLVNKIVKEQYDEMGGDEPKEFTVTGIVKVIPDPPSKTPRFILITPNKHLYGTRLIGGLYGLGDSKVRLTGITKDGKHPSHLNPLKITKEPEII